MKKQTRGLGFIFQPGYRDKKSGAEKTVATWWISYCVHGVRPRNRANHNAPTRACS